MKLGYLATLVPLSSGMLGPQIFVQLCTLAQQLVDISSEYIYIMYIYTHIYYHYICIYVLYWGLGFRVGERERERRGAVPRGRLG